MATKALTRADLKSELLPITAEVANMRDEQRLISEKTEKTYKYLFGNGDVGMDERVRNIEKQLSKLSKTFNTLALAAGGYLIVEIIKLLLEHL